MAAPATDIAFAKPSLNQRFAAFFASIGQGMSAYAHHRSRADQINMLNMKSDEELAKMGLTRDDIPRYVFRDAFYI